MVMRQRLLLLACTAVLLALGWALFGPARQAEAVDGGFVAPLRAPLTVLQRFNPPANPWLPGNRGVDLAATVGEPVVAAADGVVLYAGLLAGRGVVSVNHGALRSTYEPVDPIVSRGESVRRGEVIGRVSAVADGCGPPGGCLHWGAIRDGAYIDPLGLLGLLGPRPVRLLPVWSDGLPTSAPTDVPAAARAAVPSSAASSGTTRPTDGVAVTTFGAAAATGALGMGVAAGVVASRRARSPTTRKLPAP